MMAILGSFSAFMLAIVGPVIATIFGSGYFNGYRNGCVGKSGDVCVDSKNRFLHNLRRETIEMNIHDHDFCYDVLYI